MMLKKNLMIFLLLLCLLLVGGSSISFAYVHENTIDWVDFKNMVYYAYTSNGTQFVEYSQTLSDLLEANKSQLESIFVNNFNSYKAIIYQCSGANFNQYLYISYQDNDSAQNMYVYNNALQGNYIKWYRIRYYGMSDGGTLEISNQGNGSNNGLTMYGGGRFYTNCTIYANSSRNSTLVKDGYTYSPGNNSEFLTGVFTKNYFRFTQNQNIDLVSVNDYHNCLYIRKNGWVNGFYNIGTLEKYTNLDDITINRYRYNNMTESWNSFGTLEYGDFLFVNHFNSGDYADIDLKSTNYSTGGFIYQINFLPKNTALHNTITINCYLESDNDIFTGSTLNTSDTFSGDFYNNYNNNANNIQTNENIDNVSDTLTDGSEVDSMMNDLIGDSGDALLEQIGFSPLENPFVATIRTVLEGTQEVLLGTGQETLTLGWHDISFTLSSEDFTLPNGTIKTLVSLICNGLLVWALYKYGFKLIQWINSGRIQNMLNEVNNKDYYLF